MADRDDELRAILDDDDQAIADDEVISAARSCSAIFVIIAVVGAILCIMAGIAFAYG